MIAGEHAASVAPVPLQWPGHCGGPGPGCQGQATSGPGTNPDCFRECRVTSSPLLAARTCLGLPQAGHCHGHHDASGCFQVVECHWQSER
jgi:hypothetical protein